MKKDINFFESVAKDKSLRKIDLARSLKLSLSVSIGVCLIVSLFLFIFVRMQEAQKTNLAERRAQEAPQNRLTMALEDKATVARLEAENTSFAENLAVFNSQSTLSTEDINTIAKCQTPDMQINTFSYSNGSVVLNCIAEQEMSSVIFVNRLRIMNKFGEVRYPGVSHEGPLYSFSVVFNVKEEVTDDSNEQ